jgi:hypothetical protein
MVQGWIPQEHDIAAGIPILHEKTGQILYSMNLAVIINIRCQAYK